MKRIGAIVLVGVALASAAVFGATRTGTALPFGIAVPGADDSGATGITLGTVYFEGAGTDTTAIVGNGGSVRLTAGYGVRFTGAGPVEPRVVLERRIAPGTWRRTSARVSTPEGRPLTVMTPAYSGAAASTSVQYRLVSGASASRTMTVAYEDQHRYRGTAATIYDAVAPYCPATAVHVADLHGREAGDYRTGALLITVDRTVGRSTVLQPIDQRALALHECSHELQWTVYGATAAGRTTMEAAAKRIFSVPGDTIEPIEHAADCGAQSENPGGYLGYGGTCTGAQLRAGRRLLHGLPY